MGIFPAPLLDGIAKPLVGDSLTHGSIRKTPGPTKSGKYCQHSILLWQCLTLTINYCLTPLVEALAQAKVVIFV